MCPGDADAEWDGELSPRLFVIISLCTGDVSLLPHLLNIQTPDLNIGQMFKPQETCPVYLVNICFWED